MDLPDNTPQTWGSLVAGGLATLYALRKLLLSDRVAAANDNAQVNIIATLQAERDAAVKRADEAVAQRDQAMSMLTDLKLQVGQLQGEIQQLSAKVAKLRGTQA